MYTFEQHSFNKTGTREGILVGGNLSVMAGMRGSPLEVDFDGAILFVEDTGEFLYHVDRMMMNLWHGGILHKISGLVVGGMDDMKEADKEFGASAYELIHEKVKDLEIPVAYGFPAGHRKVNLPLLMGHPVKLSTAGPKACLDFSQSTGLEIPV
jgi:muramoyltetrapeptide carboxypeptidase